MSTDKQCDCDACAVVFRLAGPDVGASGDDDILDRLRHQWNGEYDPTGRLLSEAADEIERLRSLIIAWADASELYDGPRSIGRYVDTALALLGAVGR